MRCFAWPEKIDWAESHCDSAGYIVQQKGDVQAQPSHLGGTWFGRPPTWFDCQRTTSEGACLVGSHTKVKRQTWWKAEAQTYPRFAEGLKGSGSIPFFGVIGQGHSLFLEISTRLRCFLPRKCPGVVVC